MKVLFCQQHYNYYGKTVKSQSFHGLERLSKVSSAVKNFEMSAYNPYTGRSCFQNVSIDLLKPQNITLSNYRTKGLRSDALTLHYSPDCFGYIKDKKTGEPVKTMILSSRDPYHEEEVGFNFMSENLEKEYGYVHLSKRIRSSIYERIMDGELFKDYPALGITGPRVIVSYLRNWNDRLFGGIGKLADLMAVKYCKENNIENIVSSAEPGSHVAHFLRGKRFLPLSKNSMTYFKMLRKYGNTDPNAVIQHLIETSKSQKVYTDGWGLMGMYMPKEVFEKYAKQLNI